MVLHRQFNQNEVAGSSKLSVLLARGRYRCQHPSRHSSQIRTHLMELSSHLLLLLLELPTNRHLYSARAARPQALMGLGVRQEVGSGLVPEDSQRQRIKLLEIAAVPRDLESNWRQLHQNRQYQRPRVVRIHFRLELQDDLPLMHPRQLIRLVLPLLLEDLPLVHPTQVTRLVLRLLLEDLRLVRLIPSLPLLLEKLPLVHLRGMILNRRKQWMKKKQKIGMYSVIITKVWPMLHSAPVITN